MKEIENTRKVKAGHVHGYGKLIFSNVHTTQMVYKLNAIPVKIQ